MSACVGTKHDVTFEKWSIGYWQFLDSLGRALGKALSCDCNEQVFSGLLGGFVCKGEKESKQLVDGRGIGVCRY